MVLCKTYLRTYFIIDLLVALPLSALILEQLEPSSVWNMLSLLDVVKMVRVQRSVGRFRRGTLLNPSLWKLAVLWLVLLYQWHLLSCVYWLIESRLGLDEDEVTTMGPPVAFIDNGSFFIEYIWSFFWVISVSAGSATMPEQPVEAALASLTVMSGLFVVAGVISTTNNAVRESNTLEQRRTRRLREILQYLKARQATPRLIREVLEYYTYCFENNIGEESGGDLLNELPRILRERLIKRFYAAIIQKIPLFKELPQRILDDLVLTLKRRIYVPGEYLIVKGLFSVGRILFQITLTHSFTKARSDKKCILSVMVASALNSARTAFTSERVTTSESRRY